MKLLLAILTLILASCSHQATREPSNLTGPKFQNNIPGYFKVTNGFDKGCVFKMNRDPIYNDGEWSYVPDVSQKRLFLQQTFKESSVEPVRVDKVLVKN